MGSKDRRSNNGFTLVELLVVISIIALLLSILMPSLSKAREQARRVVCSARHKQLAIAFTMYAGDFKNFPIARQYSPGGDPYIYVLPAQTELALERYGLSNKLESINDIWSCPSNARAKRFRGYGDGAGNLTSPESAVIYVIDHHMVQTGIKASASYRGTGTPFSPSDKSGPLVADRWIWWYGEGYSAWVSNHTKNGGGYGTNVVGYNQAFSDGHVSWIPVSAIKNLTRRDGSQGNHKTGWIYQNAFYYYWVER